MIMYEHFDKNEIYLLTLLLIGYGAVILLPKILPWNISTLFLVWGLAATTLFDFTIGGGLMDYYKVNDSNHYELFDFLYYLVFPPVSYLFVYIYEKLKINKKSISFLIFVLVWSLLGLLMDWVSTKMDVIFYQNGYKGYLSFTVFLSIQTITALYYELVRKKNQTAGCETYVNK
ncbi:MAG: hypothetical protein ABF649_18760 [Bacillus sp. (in: firmicutes)]